MYTVKEGLTVVVVHLRNKVATFMQKSNLPVVNQFKKEYKTAVEPVTGETWAIYWLKMREDKVWADSVAVQGTAWYLNHDIYLIMSSHSYCIIVPSSSSSLINYFSLFWFLNYFFPIIWFKITFSLNIFAFVALSHRVSLIISPGFLSDSLPLIFGSSFMTQFWTF